MPTTMPLSIVHKSVLAIATATLLLFLVANPSHAANNFYLTDSAVDVSDGVIEDAWGDPIINDGEDDPDRVRQCWNPGLSTWSAVVNPDDCETVLYDEAGQIDMSNGWFGANETNMLLAFETASPMFSMRDMVTNEDFMIFDESKLTEWGISSLPADFAHDMVFAFDTEPVEGEENYDWYIVANINYSLDNAGSDEDFLEIWQEAGTTDGFQNTEDTLVTAINTEDSESTEFTELEQVVPTMEIRQNIEVFYAETGISVGDEVGFRLETHSTEGDTTEPVLVTFVDELAELTVDSVVVGSGARSFTGRSPKKYPQGIVSVYADDADEQTQLLQFTAYAKKLGVQVAVGDVDADGEDEIVTMPFKSVSGPEWKVFDLSGQLEASGTVPKSKGKGLKTVSTSQHIMNTDEESGEKFDELKKRGNIQRLKQYYLAVGDLDGNDRDEIVLSGAQGNRLFVDVIKVTDEGKGVRVNQFVDINRTGYSDGSWVEVADMDGTTGEEIITTPVRGKPVIDVWQLSTDGTSLDNVVQYTDLLRPGFTAGLHIASDDGMIVAVEHGKKGTVHMLEWIEAKGSFEPTDTSFNIGTVGDVAYNGSQLLYSSFTKQLISKVNASGDDIYDIDTDHRGGFVEYLVIE